MTEPSKAVFLSYASQDAEAARRICEELRAAGIVVWFDQSELRGGDAWDQKIRREIRECALFLPIISANTNARPEGYFRLEWKLAVDRSHLMADDEPFLLPIVIDETPDANARVPDRFRQVQWMRLLNGAASPIFGERISRLLAQGAAATPATIVVREISTARWRAVNTRGSRRSIYGLLLISGAAVVTGGYFALHELARSKHGASAPPPQETAQTALPLPAAAPAPEKSIAVLPFVDMSEKHDQQYFSDGLSEELINQLAQNTGLKVIARTSAFQFRDKSEDIRLIAGKLGVAYLLEGSVRKSANKIRITTQLIRAADGVHLWSNAYDRYPTDVFKVQDEIAKTVANALQVSLANGVTPRGTGTKNLEAYNLYLQAASIARTANDRSDYLKVIDYVRTALKADPSYAPAWALLADTLSEQAEAGFGSKATLIAEARNAAKRAIELNPNGAEAHAAMARILVMDDWNFKSGEIELRKALEADPNHPLALTLSAQLAMYAGRLIDSEELRNRSIRNDPANPWRYWDLSVTLFYQRRFAESLAASRHMLDLNPGMTGTHMWVGKNLLAMGDPAAALSEMDREPDEKDRLSSSSRVIAYDALGRKADADAALSGLETKYAGDSAYGIGEIYANRNEFDRAFHWFERAYQQHDDDLTTIKVDPLLKNVQSDPRFNVLVRKLNLPE